MYCYFEDSTILDHDKRRQMQMCIKIGISHLPELLKLTANTKWILVRIIGMSDDDTF